MNLRLVLFGAPGSGKGTQAACLQKKFDIIHVSTGDLFRKSMKDGTYLGKQVQKYMDKGFLVPDEVVNDLVKHELSDKIQASNFVFDGYPRTLPQARKLDEMLENKQYRLDAVLSLEVPVHLLVHRISGRRLCLSCGSLYHIDTLGGNENCVKDQTPLVQRKDDEEQTVRVRLDAFRKLTLPLKEYYRSVNLLREIDGSGTAPEVFEQILQTLKPVEVNI